MESCPVVMMPGKFKLYERYVREQSLRLDLKLIFLTLIRITK